jgi:hypothetical protein
MQHAPQPAVRPKRSLVTTVLVTLLGLGVVCVFKSNGIAAGWNPLQVGFALAARPFSSTSPSHHLAASTVLHANRGSSTVMLYEDDPWLQSSEPSPLSEESLEVLWRYGPVVYGNRCTDPAEYNASVRKMMSRNPRISRARAEQEINEFLKDATSYISATTDKGYKGPLEDDLLPPVKVKEKILVVLWVLVLLPAVSFLVDASVNAPPVNPQVSLDF